MTMWQRGDTTQAALYVAAFGRLVACRRRRRDCAQPLIARLSPATSRPSSSPAVASSEFDTK